MVKNYAGRVAHRSWYTEEMSPEHLCLLCNSARDGFTNIYAQETEETWKAKEKEGVEPSAGEVRLFSIFPSESVRVQNE